MSAPARERKADIATRLAEMRSRTLALVAPLAEADDRVAPAPFVGPVGWDLPHIANFEELWLVKRLGPERSRYQDRGEGLDDAYDAQKNPKPARTELPLPSRKAALRYLDEVREETLRTLAALDLDGDDPLARGGFVHEMVLQHEAQHQETMLITLALMPAGRYVPKLREPKPQPRVPVDGMVDVPAGAFDMGADLAPGVYDNEAPRTNVHVDAYAIARAPVTNGEYLRFVEAGGYEREDLWSEDGWLLKEVKGWAHPMTWTRDDAGRWWIREFDRMLPLPLDEPVAHVSWYEADAYARFAGMRLPTEAEWEKAAAFDPATGRSRRFPWGDEPWTAARANLDQRLYGPAPVGAYPDGASALGCHQMLGDVWEWTATEFAAYPGFEAFPYDEYSKEFLGKGYYVLRGGSWATRPHVARATFRNWHQPDHQQEFAGFRLAGPAGSGA